MLKPVFLALAAAAFLSGCATETVWAPDDVVARAAYRHNGPTALTLYTMINNRSGEGAHTSLMVNASQRVLFDPAGSVKFTAVPERNDVLYGITPAVKTAYASAHARSTYHVMIQEIEVSPEVAELALKLVQENGAVSQAQCALSTSSILKKLPGFENIKTGWFPGKLAAQFGALPGVVTTTVYEDDDDDKSVAIQALDAQLGNTN